MQDLQTPIITKYLDVILCTSYWRDDPEEVTPPATKELITAIYPHGALQQPATTKKQDSTFL